MFHSSFDDTPGNSREHYTTAGGAQNQKAPLDDAALTRTIDGTEYVRGFRCYTCNLGGQFAPRRAVTFTGGKWNVLWPPHTDPVPRKSCRGPLAFGSKMGDPVHSM